MKTRDKDGNIIVCSDWKNDEDCLNCPDRIGCDVLGKWHLPEDFWNPSRRNYSINR
jgi:hypothetical protein